MSQYKGLYECQSCGNEHSTDNVVATCASCVHKLCVKILGYEKAGPEDAETKMALENEDKCFDEFLWDDRLILARALRSAWKSLSEVTRERNDWKDECLAQQKRAEAAGSKVSALEASEPYTRGLITQLQDRMVSLEAEKAAMEKVVEAAKHHEHDTHDGEMPYYGSCELCRVIEEFQK